MLVADVMSKDVVTISPTDDLLMVADTLMRHKISGAFVLKRGRLLGTVSKESFMLSLRYLGSKSVSELKVEDFLLAQKEYVSPDNPFSEVVVKMDSHPHRLDRLPVLKDGKLVGVVTKGDVARIYSERMKGKFKVKDLMEYEPVIAYDFLPISTLIDKLNLSRTKQAIYVQGRRLMGVVTVLDLALVFFKHMREHPSEDPFKKILMEDVVSKNIVTASPNEDAAEAAKKMSEKRFGSLPVLEGGQVKGLITTSSFINGFKYNMDVLNNFF
ncbi:MAG: CBS domain-containing protein [Candidatus Altiarchaeota archaeon]